MNYSRDSVERKLEILHSPFAAFGRKAGAYIYRAVFFLFIAAVVGGISLGYGMIRGIIADTPDVSSLNISPSGFATIIYDANGTEMQKLVSANANRMAVSIDKVPADLRNAVVAIEDERFWQHNGIDPRGMVRAASVIIRTRFQSTQGASTITQQLLKNNVFVHWTEERGWAERIRRKIQEQYLAVQLEKKLNDKNLILENYLNTINLGAGTYGVEAAARKYFNKDVWDLNLSETMAIAGITQNPSSYNPIRHPDWNAERRELVLKKMVDLGYITEEQRAECLADDVYARIEEAQLAEQQQSQVYSYFVDELTDQVVNDLIEVKGYTETQAYQAVYSGGLRIFTTQDQHIQAICDEEFMNDANFPNATEYELDWAYSLVTPEGETKNFSREMLQAYFQEHGNPNFDLKFSRIETAEQYVARYKSIVTEEDDVVTGERISLIPQPQASMMVMDQETGFVRAIVGGRGKKIASLTLNRATNTARQPGSTFKITSTYGPALDMGRISLATTYVDEPYKYANGHPVQDWLVDHYVGRVTVREAIISSLNIPAVKCITDITPQVGFEESLRFGFTTLSPKNDVYQPLALGGLYNGVSVLELTAAYAAIANEGVYTKPIFYTKILDQFGNVILDNTPETYRVIKPSTAFLLTSAMESVIDRGTGRTCQIPNMHVAGKSGTTQDYRDLWFVGYTPYYTCGIWTGNDNGSPLPSEGTYHEFFRTLWTSVMKRIHEDLPDRPFEKPDDVVVCTVCESTGQLATDSCPKKITEYFAAETAPTAECAKHLSGLIDADDYSYFRGYGTGGNGVEPGAYALGMSDLYQFSLEEGTAAYEDYLEAYYARQRAIEEERRRREEEAARAAEEAAQASEEDYSRWNNGSTEQSSNGVPSYDNWERYGDDETSEG